MSDADSDVDMSEAPVVLTYEEVCSVLCNPEQFALKECVWYALRAEQPFLQRLLSEHPNHCLASRLGVTSAELDAVLEGGDRQEGVQGAGSAVS